MVVRKSTPLNAVVIDTETTGLDPAEARIVEFAAIRILGGRLSDEMFRSLVSPGVSIPAAATSIHHIDDGAGIGIEEIGIGKGVREAHAFTTLSCSLSFPAYLHLVVPGFPGSRFPGSWFSGSEFLLRSSREPRTEPRTPAAPEPRTCTPNQEPRTKNPEPRTSCRIES